MKLKCLYSYSYYTISRKKVPMLKLKLFFRIKLFCNISERLHSKNDCGYTLKITQSIALYVLLFTIPSIKNINYSYTLHEFSIIFNRIYSNYFSECLFVFYFNHFHLTFSTEGLFLNK